MKTNLIGIILKLFSVVLFNILFYVDFTAQNLHKQALGYYNWGIPDNDILNWAQQDQKKKVENIYLVGIYSNETEGPSNIKIEKLIGFQQIDSKKKADIIGSKFIRNDSVFILGQDNLSESIFQYVFKKTSGNLELLDIQYENGYLINEEDKKLFIQPYGANMYNSDTVIYTRYELQKPAEVFYRLNNKQLPNSPVRETGNNWLPIEVVQSNLTAQNQQGVFDAVSNEMILPFDFCQLYLSNDVTNKTFIVKSTEDNLSAIFDSKGNRLTDFIFNGLIHSVIASEETFSIIDTKTKEPMVLNFKGDILFRIDKDEFTNHFVCRIKNGFYLLVDQDLEVNGVVTPQGNAYSVDWHYRERETLWSGLRCINQQFDENGMCSIEAGLLNKKGEVFLDPKLSFVSNSSIEYGLAAVQNQQGKIGYINAEFNLVIPCIYDSLGNFNDQGVIELKLNNENNLIDRYGKTIK